MACVNYDFTWLEEGLLKRRANYSNIICFETGDSFRFSQFKYYLLSLKEYSEADIYYLNRWAGLCRMVRENGNLEKVKREVRGGYDKEVKNTIENRDALQYMDNILKSRKVIFVVHDVDASRDEDKDRDIIYAFRDWAYSPEIFLSESLIILMCTNVSMVLDAATLERVAILRPPVALPEEREKVIIEEGKKLIENLQQSEVKFLVQATAGLNLHQLRTTLLESYNTTKTFTVETIKEIKSDLIRRSDLLEIEEPDPAGFNSVGGYDCVKRFVSNTIIRVLSNPERAQGFNIKIPRGIIFFGPPGTGKTLFARALAREIHLPFINLRTENLYSQYLGVSGQRFRDAINVIEHMSPAVVFIDEIDRFGKRRGEVSDGASEETRRVFSQVLEWLGKKERKSIIIGTTNLPQDLDPAFRVGRIDYWIPFLYPNRTARVQILKIYLQRINLDEGIIQKIADKTEGYSGAEIEELVNRTNRIAFVGPNETVTQDDLFRALSSFRIDVKSREKKKDDYLKIAEEFTNDLEFLRELREER